LASIDKYFKARIGVETPDLLTSSATISGNLNVPEPVSDSNAATKKYVDDLTSVSTVPSASAYPLSADQYSLFFNTSTERMAVRVGSIWKELAFISDISLESGGDSFTSTFNQSVDGGDSSTTSFVNNYDGGASA